MEVLLRGVPVHLSDDNCKRELRPFMNALGIFTFSCEKPRKSATVWVNFVSRADGERFMQKHGPIINNPGPPDNGQRPNNDGGGGGGGNGRRNNKKNNSNNNKGQSDSRACPRTMARLHLLKTAIYVGESSRPVDAHVTNALALERERLANLPPRDPRLPPIRTQFSSIACGKTVFVFDGGTGVLTFVQQTHMVLPKDHVAQFGRQNFSLTVGDGWRMDIPNTAINDLITDVKMASFTLVLSEPPRFYQRIVPDEEQPQSRGYETWRRKTCIEGWKGHSVHVAGCLAYRFNVLASLFHDTRDQLKIREILPVSRQSMPVDLTPRPRVLDYATSLAVFMGKISAFARGQGKSSLFPFVILFQVQALVSNDYLHPASGTRMLEEMERKAVRYKEEGRPFPFSAQSMRHLFQMIPYPCAETDPQDLRIDRLLDDVMQREAEYERGDPGRDAAYGSRIQDHQAWVLKATVTPTRILLGGPDPESMNRVLRQFEDHIDFFLRVTFGDEGGQDLPYNPKVSNRDMFERYRKVLRDGIRIAGRHFSFLGFSHSSLRSHSVWFAAPFTDGNMRRQNADSIIRDLGDFSGIKIPAKCAARIGQAFSETPFEINLHKIHISSIVDVKYKDRVFSDGVGTISRAAMELIWDNIPRKLQTPTCFQIRLGGIKGMLSLDTRLKGRVIGIREGSMMKFESKHTNSMGICDMASQPLRMYLNRQLIKILEDMGTDDSWFLNQQQKALQALRTVTATAKNTATFLEYQVVGSAVGLPKLIKLLDNMNINYQRDSFIKSVVEHVVLQELRLLKHKARIPVDQGVTLFGVMDETGFLQEGEIFVTFDSKHDRVQGRIKGSLRNSANVIVTRSPALHPGDIQCVRMVTPPEGHPLRSLQNCVVFSQKGTRDLPSQLSGGDLDGDLYSVIWDPQARPQRQFAPADYPRANPQGLPREVTREDIADFFVKFMETDILGLIAIRHQILADIHPEGTRHMECIELAELHSTAVDYSKTGIPVPIQDLPRAPRTRPDFLAPAPPIELHDLDQIDYIAHGEDSDDEGDGMGSPSHLFHKSEKILGRLYRAIDEQKIWSEEIRRPTNMDGPTVWDQFLERVEANLTYHGYEFGEIVYQRRLEDAWKIRNFYESAISETMWQYSENPRVPLKEVEVFCGSILRKTASHSRRERDSSMKLKDHVDEQLSWIVKLIRDRTSASIGDDFISPPPADDGGERARMNAVELCWACVVVGGARGRHAPAGSGEMESFRVVAACCLAKELTELLNYSANVGDYRGGYLGKSGHMVLAMR